MTNEEEKKHDLSSSDGLADFFSDVDDDDLIDGDYDDIDQIIDEVMALLENYGPVTGGLITFTTIYNYLQQGNHPNLTRGDCFDVIARMRTNQVILDEITYSDFPDLYIYIFQDVHISENGKILLKFFAQNNSLGLQPLREQSQWDEAKITEILQELESLKLVKIEGDLYSVPAFSL